MPPRRLISPRTLEELCLCAIVEYLGRECLFCNQVRKHQNDSLLLRRRGINARMLEKELESYLDVLPPLLNELVRQHVTNEVLKANSKSVLSQPEIYIGLLAIVLNKEVKSLEFTTETHITLSAPVWQIVSKKCTGLKRFNLTQENGIQCPINVQPLLKKVISNNSTLTEVILKDISQGHETFSVIGRNCPNLRVLDVTGSLVNCVELAHLFIHSPKNRNINIDSLLDDAFELPTNPLCTSLEVLVIADTKVRVRGAALAVKLLPNLVSLGSFTHLPAALKRLYGTKSKPLCPLKIIQAAYYGPSHTKLKALSNCCPKLEILQLGHDKLRGIVPSYLVYKHLRNLTLENVEFEALLACTTILPQLIELKLSTVGIDVGLLGQYCQNLEKLWLCGEPLKTLSRSPNSEHFSKLKKLKMQCIASAECVGYIIRNASELRVIDMIRVKELNDVVFAEWFRWNPLQHLETLLIRYADLTRATVDLLLAHCTQLTRLGELGGWDIRSWECRRIKDLILKENYRLHVVLNTRNADSIIIDILTENTSSDEELAL